MQSFESLNYCYVTSCVVVVVVEVVDDGYLFEM